MYILVVLCLLAIGNSLVWKNLFILQLYRFYWKYIIYVSSFQQNYTTLFHHLLQLAHDSITSLIYHMFVNIKCTVNYRPFGITNFWKSSVAFYGYLRTFRNYTSLLFINIINFDCVVSIFVFVLSFMNFKSWVVANVQQIRHCNVGMTWY